MSRAGFLFAAACVIAASAVAAQQPGFTRTPLQDQPLSAPGHHGVTARVEFAAGAESGRHTHPGDELGYVLEGVMHVEIDGKPAASYKAGDVFFIPAGTVHSGHNVSAARAVMIGSYFVEVGKPLSVPVK